MREVIFNQIGVQGVWFACVLGAASGLPWLGIACAAPWIALVLARHATPAREAVLVLGAGVVGAVADVALIRVGGVAYAGEAPGALPGPLWIVALWMAYATSVNVCLRWLRGRAWLGAAFGGFGGPLAYVAGERLGGVVLATPLLDSLVGIGVVWGIAFPLLVRIAEWTESTPRLERFDPLPRQPAETP